MFQGRDETFKKYLKDFISWLNQREGAESSSDRSGQFAQATYFKKMRKKEAPRLDEIRWSFEMRMITRLMA